MVVLLIKILAVAGPIAATAAMVVVAILLEPPVANLVVIMVDRSGAYPGADGVISYGCYGLMTVMS